MESHSVQFCPIVHTLRHGGQRPQRLFKFHDEVSESLTNFSMRWRTSLIVTCATAWKNSMESSAVAKAHSQHLGALQSPVKGFVPDTGSPVEVSERGSIVVENNCCIRIAIFADHFLLAYEVVLQLVSVDSDIRISTASIRSGNPNYVPITQRNSNFVAYTTTVTLVRITLRGEWLRFLNRTIRSMNVHAKVGNGRFSFNHSEGKVDLQQGVVSIYIYIYLSHTVYVLLLYLPWVGLP